MVGLAVVSPSFLWLFHLSSSRRSNSSHAEHGSEDLLSALPRAYVSRGPIPFRPSVHRPRTGLRAVSRKDSRTARVREGVLGLLTSLQAMWLMDLRQRRKQNRRRRM